MAVTPLKIRFGKLLRDNLRSAEIKQNELAAHLKVSGAAVSQMIHGKIVPNQHQLDTTVELLGLDRIQAFELSSMLAKIRTGAENMLSPFNQLFQRLRCQRQLTLRQLSNLSGMSIAHLKAFETCQDAVPTFDEAAVLAPILECTPMALLQSAGVGGFSLAALEELEKAGGENVSEVMEAAAAYHAEAQTPMLDLSDLAEYSGQDYAGFSRRIASKVYDKSLDFNFDVVVVQATGRDLALGFSGMVHLFTTAERNPAYRDLDLCRDGLGKFFLLEERPGKKIKEFRLAGSHRYNGEVVWRVPVVELRILPLQVGKRRKPKA